MDDLCSTPVGQWTESMVSKWLASIGEKENYIQKFKEEEVDGRILVEINEEFLKKEIGMKSGPAHVLIKRRDELIKTFNKGQKQPNNAKEKTTEKSEQAVASIKDKPVHNTPEKTDNKEDSDVIRTAKRDSKPRPFCKSGIEFTYRKRNVLPPESGVTDLISPCHEYKAFTVAATKDKQRLQAKLAKEVLKFATGCINMRSNGTIHFGIMDNKEDHGYVHGEIMGIPIKEKDMYTDALDYIERSFSTMDSEAVRHCIRPPEFILVVDLSSKEEHYVVEFDIVPTVSIVRNKVFSVRLPNFREKANKIEYEKETVFRRVGAKTEPAEASELYRTVQTRDAQREEAEKAHSVTSPDLCQDLGRKLIMLVTGGKKLMEKEKWYILVTNRFPKEDLNHIDFLLNMNIFAVFDFDPDSKKDGLCQEYTKHHAANLHFMHNYKIPNSDMTIREFENHLHLFEQTSWIFCNGRSDFEGKEPHYDENTWCKTRRTFLKDCVSFICKDILPKGTFLVIFLLTSPVETPLLNTFYEFFTDMEGHEDIICISESAENFNKWQAFALGSCDEETVNTSSVVGMKMSHINATLQRIQTTTTRAAKFLPVYVKGECCLEKCEEERMCSLEILSANQCEDTNPEFVQSEKEETERQFYFGGKVTWMNFWLAEKKFVGEVIQRDAYHEVTKLMKDCLQWNVDQMFVNCINIYHHPGSGGSTIARQVLWNKRKELRCAVVKPSYPVGTVSEHAVKLREYEERDPQKCCPVLLLIEDCDNEYLEDLKNELEVAVYTKKIAHGTPCFVLLTCRRSYTPEKMCKESPLRNVSVTHKLSEEEKRLFSGKRKKLEQQYQPEFILTFVLMSEEFENKFIAKYVKQFVMHLLQDIDRASVVTRLIRYVALLNTYVQNSFISRSHCEALFGLSLRMDRFQQHEFETSLSEQAKLVLIHLRDERTHIKSIRIIHPLVAKELLQQLLGDQEHSDLALDLLNNTVLFEHRFGREDYQKFLRALFMRRMQKCKGDISDSFFSPLIEHVRENESPEKAIGLLKEAYTRFNKDAFFAQQLARLACRHERFEEAEQWANTAASKQPKNSYILDTRGQVYKRWFTAKCKAIEKTHKTAESTADAIETALKAIECFEECEKVAVADIESMNNSGFFAVVEVGCSLLKLISSLPVFSNKTDGRSELVNYLMMDHIPKEIEKPWEQFHDKIKKIQSTMRGALEFISEDLSYFQTDLNTDEEEASKSSELTISYPKHWLVTKSSVYGKFFSKGSLSTLPRHWQSNPATIAPFLKRMIIYQLGGGNITSVFSILDQKDKERTKILEDIISLYPKNPMGAKMPQMDLVNYISVHFALSAASAQSPSLAAFSDLQRLSNLFPQDKSKCLASALFFRILLYWPEENDTDCEKEDKYETVLSAVKFLGQTYVAKMKDIPQRRRRIYTHFFLGKGTGYDKFVHKTKIEALKKFPSISEKRMKWYRGEMWKTPEIAAKLKPVTGWTEDGTVYLQCPATRKFQIPALNMHSMPYGNENVTFYLGFTFRGPVAYNITVKK